MTDKKIIVQFTMMTFCIAYFIAGALIALGQLGFSVHNWVHSLQQFVMNIPYAIYILSPAIASYIVLKKNNKIADFKEWLKNVFYARNNISLSFSFRGRIIMRGSLTFGCLQFNSLRFGFSTGQSTKYQEKAVCLCAYYSTPCSMRHPPSLAP